MTTYIALAMLMSCVGQQPPASNPDYSVMEITLSDETLASKYSASIRGKSDIAVFPQVSGYITKVFVEEGSRVYKGQPLFMIDQVPYLAALETAEANVSVAEANVETARLTYESKQELFNNNVVSSFELKTAENALASAMAQLKLTLAQETKARNDLSYTVVKSPSNGVVGTLPFKIGASVGPSVPVPLTTVSDNSEMYVYFSMTENQLLAIIREYESVEAAIKSMPPVQLELSDGSMYQYDGKIETISGVIDQVTGSLSLKAVFSNKGRLLHSGGSGNVIIPRQWDGAIVVPKSATFEIQDKIYVFKVVDGIAKSSMISVNPVSRNGEYIVESGLAPGDLLITEGVGFIRDGVPVNVKQ